MAIALALAAVFAAALFAATGTYRREAAAVESGLARDRKRRDWPSLGVRFFAAVGGVAIVLAATYAVRGAAGAGWLLPAAGLLAGALLLFLCWRVIGPRFVATANAAGGAGIAVLYATLYALHRSWDVPLPVTFVAMALVTVVAAMLAIRRDSLFLALLGLAGGVAVPALLGFDQQALPLFSYLLVLNCGAAWIAYRRDWPVLIALAVTLTAVYEWAWVLQYMAEGELAAAAAMFAALAVVGTAPLWHPPQTEQPGTFRTAAVATALLPFLFAFHIAAEPNYARHYNVVFGFLFVVAGGIAAIVVWRRDPRWLHAAGGAAVLVTFFLWFTEWLRQLRANDLFPAQPLPGLATALSIWIVLFVALYLIGPTLFAGLMFSAFVLLALRQPLGAPEILAAIAVALAAVLVVTIRARRPLDAVPAVVLASLAVMALNPLPLLFTISPAHALQPAPMAWVLVAAQTVLVAAFFVVAWAGRRPWVSLLAVPLYAGTIATTYSPAIGGTTAVVFILLPYVAFVAYAFLVRERDAVEPPLALLLAGIVLLLTVASGLVALLLAAVFAALLVWWWIRRHRPSEAQFALVASAALAFFDIALVLLLLEPWAALLCAFQVPLLVALYRRFARTTLLVWAAGVAAVVFAWIALDSTLYLWWVYTPVGLAMYAAAYLAQGPRLRLYFSLVGLTVHWMFINIFIANRYRSTGVALNLSFDFAGPREDVTYTIAWAVVATILLVIGVLLPWRGARVGAASLLILTSLKSFFHDLPRLADYRVASLLAVALAFTVVSIVLQKFVLRRAAAT